MFKYIIIAVVLVPVVPILFFKGAISAGEIRYYVAVLILLFTAVTFGVLRLYNSVYSNSLIMLRLSKVFKDVSTALQRNDQAIANGVKAMNNLTKQLKKEVDGDSKDA